MLRLPAGMMARRHFAGSYLRELYLITAQSHSLTVRHTRLAPIIPEPTAAPTSHVLEQSVSRPSLDAVRIECGIVQIDASLKAQLYLASTKQTDSALKTQTLQQHLSRLAQRNGL